MLALVAGSLVSGTSVSAKMNKKFSSSHNFSQRNTDQKDNWKIDKNEERLKTRNKVIKGAVVSGDSVNGWVVATKKYGNITVVPDANTKYFVLTKGKKGKTAGSSADVMTGFKIQARGVWDSAAKTLTKVLTITVTK